MNDRTPESSTQAASDSVAEYAAGTLWNALLDEDQLDIDVELLAAYADGALDEPQRQRIKKLVARSPRAMELLHGLRNDLRSAPPATVPLSAAVGRTRKAAWQRAIAPLLAAAALLLAIGTSMWVVNDARQQLAQAKLDLRDRDTAIETMAMAIKVERQQFADHARVLASKQRERLYALAGDRAPVLAVRSDPAVARLALAFRDSAPRGLSDLTPEQRAVRESEIDSVLNDADQALNLDPSGSANLLDRAALHLAAGRRGEALSLVSEAESAAGESATTLTLRAAIAMTEAMAVESPDQAAELHASARELLQRAIQLDANDPLPWFNLALLEEDLGNDTEARAAWGEYLARETDESMQAIVRESRGL